MKAKRLISALSGIFEEVTSSKQGKTYDFIYKDEVGEIIAEFLEDIYVRTNIRDIERRVVESRRVDTTLIRNTLAALKNSNPQEFDLNFQSGTSRTVKPLEHINRLEQALRPLEEKPGKLGDLEVGLRLEMYFDSYFDEILMSLPSDSVVFEQIKTALISKLNLLDKDTILLLWARVKASFNQTEYRNGFIEYSDILPKDFWSEVAELAEIADRLASFVCKYKPLTIRKMVANGYNGHPAGVPGVAKILSITSNKYIKIQNIDILVIRLASRISALYSKITYRDTSELAKSIGADPNSIIFDGEYYHEFVNYIDGEKTWGRLDLIKILRVNFERLSGYAEEYYTSRSNIADAIWNFKLGQEIIFPERKKAETRELTLQKHLSKYLAEKGILSFGRQFGRSEIDLYIKDMNGEDFAVEVKVYKGPVSEKRIKSNLVQLQSYMDQLHQPRGVLAIYNFGPDIIVSPRKWINGRIWILAINLCSLAPNKRNRSIEILESEDAKQMISCIENSSRVQINSSGKGKTKRKIRRSSVL